MRLMQLSLACVVLALAGCPRPTPRTATLDHRPPEWTRDAVVYEVNVRQFTPEGTFQALTGHLRRLDDLGVDILWLMPVQPIGRDRRKGSLGSYYSIADYTAINPEHGSVGDFRAFVDSTHALGMKVILDWVANHSAFDHPWTREHRDWYVSRADGTISNARDNEGRETDWTDVAELNYDSPELRQAMIDEMRWWVDSMGIDGFRADVALGVPADFWADAARQLTAVRPDLFLLAEAESPASHEVFHATYGWEFHHLLNEISQGKKGTGELDAYFARQEASYPPDAMRMYFTSNHDENSWQGTEFERMGQNHVPAFVLSATVKQSLPLLYSGQEVSNAKRLRFFEKDTIDWSGQSRRDFYRSLFDLKEREAALWNGAWGGDQKRLETGAGDRVYAFTRTRGESTVLVAVNFGDSAAVVRYENVLSSDDALMDGMTDGSPVMLPSAGAIEVPAHGYRILVRRDR